MNRVSMCFIAAFAAAPLYGDARLSAWRPVGSQPSVPQPSIPQPSVPQPSVPQPRTVAVENAIYQIGEPELIAPAPVGSVILHPTGRYALIVQEIEERTANPGPNDKPLFGAAALLLYDAKLHETRAVWKRHATTKGAGIYPAWLPKSDCAIVTTDESPALPPVKKGTPDALGTLLFFNFDTRLTPRTLATTPYDIVTSVSPTKPFFIEWDLADNVTRMGSAPRGTLGPVLQTLDFDFKSWSRDGTTVYGREFFINQYDTAPRNEAERLKRLNAKPESALQWYQWDGKSREAIKLPGPPAESMKARETPAPVLPLTLRTSMLPVPFPSADKAQTQSAPVAPIAVLRPLFLEASRPAPDKIDSASRIAFIAPDADAAYLLPDLSAVLYKAGGALYAAALTCVKAGEPQAKRSFP